MCTSGPPEGLPNLSTHRARFADSFLHARSLYTFAYVFSHARTFCIFTTSVHHCITHSRNIQFKALFLRFKRITHIHRHNLSTRIQQGLKSKKTRYTAIGGGHLSLSTVLSGALREEEKKEEGTNIRSILGIVIVVIVRYAYICIYTILNYIYYIYNIHIRAHTR